MNFESRHTGQSIDLYLSGNCIARQILGPGAMIVQVQLYEYLYNEEVLVAALKHIARSLEITVDTPDLTIADLSLFIEAVGVQVRTADQALDETVSDPRLPCRVYYDVQWPYHAQTLCVSFITEANFCFWKEIPAPEPGNDQFVIPRDHPVLDKQRHAKFTIIGPTQEVASEVVVHVYPPPEAIRIQSTWDTLKDPVKAEVTYFNALLSLPRLLNPGGARAVADFLLAALQVDGEYIAVRGGFYPPPPYTDNRYGTWNNAHCVWTYKILASRGELDGVHLPSWFVPEEWM